jgi:hypothetical protein
MTRRMTDVTTLAFHGREGSAEILVHSAVVIRVVRGALYAGGPVMALLVKGAWYVGDQRLERIAITGPVRVEFQNAGDRRAFGPFADVSLLGDAALTGGEVFARYRSAEEAWDFSGDSAPGGVSAICPAAVLTPT